MAAPDSTQLMEDARCIFTCVPEGMQMPILISVFAKIAGVSADPTSLMEDARCLFTCIPPGMQGPILINLASQMATGALLSIPSGNYGGAQPNFTPTVATTIAIDTSNGTLWEWYANAWH